MTYAQALAKYKRDGVLTGVWAWVYLMRAPRPVGRPRMYRNDADRLRQWRKSVRDETNSPETAPASR